MGHWACPTDTPLSWGNPEIPPTMEEEPADPCRGRLTTTMVNEDDPLCDEERRAASLGVIGDRCLEDISPSCRTSDSTGEATHISYDVDGSCLVLVEDDMLSIPIGVAFSWHSRSRSSSLEAANGGSFEMYSLKSSMERSVVWTISFCMRKRCRQFKVKALSGKVKSCFMNYFCHHRVSSIPWTSPS